MHRVGRTARAGCGGRAVSLVPDAARLLMKQVVADVAAQDKGSVKSRVVPPAVLAHYEGKVAGLQVRSSPPLPSPPCAVLCCALSPYTQTPTQLPTNERTKKPTEPSNKTK